MCNDACIENLKSDAKTLRWGVCLSDGIFVCIFLVFFIIFLNKTCRKTFRFSNSLKVVAACIFVMMLAIVQRMIENIITLAHNGVPISNKFVSQFYFL